MPKAASTPSIPERQPRPLRPVGVPATTLIGTTFSRRLDRMLFTQSVNDWLEQMLPGAADATDDEITPHHAAGLSAPLAARRLLAGRQVTA
jgi:hypothetical protein